MKTWRFYICYCITVNCQEYHDNVPFRCKCKCRNAAIAALANLGIIIIIIIIIISLHLIANKTLELLYENAPECTTLKWKKIKNFLERGLSGDGA